MLDLGKLADPACYNEPLDIGGCDAGMLPRLLEKMILIRKTEEAIAAMDKAGDVRCPAHLAIGQEAIPAGVSEYLRSDDRAFGCHRSHAHYLAMGGAVDGLLAEVLGKETGCSKGMGGSMHIYAGEAGFKGSVPIVAGTVPMAVGAAWAAKLDGGDSIGVAFFGDGACEEGVVHESLNMAAIHEIPVLFVVENNLFSSHMDIHLRQPGNRVARFADANGIVSQTVDGNDCVAVAKAARDLIEMTRRTGRPAMLEGVTYRWCGHVGPDDNIDVGLKRSAADISAWKKRDPVMRLVTAMQRADLLDEVTFERMNKDIAERIDQARTRAYEAPYPQPERLTEAVYATGK